MAIINKLKEFYSQDEFFDLLDILSVMDELKEDYKAAKNDYEADKEDIFAFETMQQTKEQIANFSKECKKLEEKAKEAYFATLLTTTEGRRALDGDKLIADVNEILEALTREDFEKKSTSQSIIGEKAKLIYPLSVAGCVDFIKQDLLPLQLELVKKTDSAGLLDYINLQARAKAESFYLSGSNELMTINSNPQKALKDHFCFNTTKLFKDVFSGFLKETKEQIVDVGGNAKVYWQAETSFKLIDFDRCVFSTVCSLYLNAERQRLLSSNQKVLFSIKDVADLLSRLSPYREEDNIPRGKDFLEAIENSIDLMRNIKIKINTNDQVKKWKKGVLFNEDVYSYLLPLTKITAVGSNSVIFYEAEFPRLFEYALGINQIENEEVILIEEKGKTESTTTDSSALRFRIREKIITMKALIHSEEREIKKQSSKADQTQKEELKKKLNSYIKSTSTINFDDIYKVVAQNKSRKGKKPEEWVAEEQTKELSRAEKQRARILTFSILESLIKEGRIKDYTVKDSTGKEYKREPQETKANSKKETKPKPETSPEKKLCIKATGRATLKSFCLKFTEETEGNKHQEAPAFSSKMQN